MTTATTEQKQEQTNNAAEEQELSADQQNAVTFLGNQMLANVNMAEAFSLVPLSQLINLVQQQVIQQAKAQVEKMSDEEVAKVLEDAETVGS
jgi:preprotein translocase subunit Sec63